MVLAALAVVVVGLATNDAIDVGTVRDYVFNRLILRGVVYTLELTAVAMVVGVALGVVLAVMRQSPSPAVSGVAWLYVWFFRGTPLLVQIVFWSNFGALYRHLSLGIPFTHAVAHSWNTNTVLTNAVAGYVAFSLNEAAYMAEIVRGGLLAVDEGQTEAALSLGMGRGLLMRRIVLPQAIRVIIPPTGNELISMLKNTSLVAIVAGGADLFSRAQDIYNNNLKVIPLLVVASLWYLAITSALSVGQVFLERRYARGSSRATPSPFWSRFRSLMSARHA